MNLKLLLDIANNFKESTYSELNESYDHSIILSKLQNNLDKLRKKDLYSDFRKSSWHFSEFVEDNDFSLECFSREGLKKFLKAPFDEKYLESIPAIVKRYWYINIKWDEIKDSDIRKIVPSEATKKINRNSIIFWCDKGTFDIDSITVGTQFLYRKKGELLELKNPLDHFDGDLTNLKNLQSTNYAEYRKIVDNFYNSAIKKIKVLCNYSNDNFKNREYSTVTSFFKDYYDADGYAIELDVLKKYEVDSDKRASRKQWKEYLLNLEKIIENKQAYYKNIVNSKKVLDDYDSKLLHDIENKSKEINDIYIYLKSKIVLEFLQNEDDIDVDENYFQKPLIKKLNHYTNFTENVSKFYINAADIENTYSNIRNLLVKKLYYDFNAIKENLRHLKYMIRTTNDIIKNLNGFISECISDNTITNKSMTTISLLSSTVDSIDIANIDESVNFNSSNEEYSESYGRTFATKQTNNINVFWIQPLKDCTFNIPDDFNFLGYAENSLREFEDVSGETINLKNGQKFYIVAPDKNINKNWANLSELKYLFSSFDFAFNIGGDITTLLNNLGNVKEIPDFIRFESLFNLNKSIHSAYDLILPSIKLSPNCYEYLFAKSSLYIAPKVLPATVLNTGSYKNMFYECKNLIKGPKIISAKNVANKAMDSMFESCTSLKETPQFNFEHISMFGCCAMFLNCTSLEKTVNEINVDFIGEFGCGSMFCSCKKLKFAPYIFAKKCERAALLSIFRKTALQDFPKIMIDDIGNKALEFAFGETTIDNSNKLFINTKKYESKSFARMLALSTFTNDENIIFSDNVSEDERIECLKDIHK